MNGNKYSTLIMLVNSTTCRNAKSSTTDTPTNQLMSTGQHCLVWFTICCKSTQLFNIQDLSLLWEILKNWPV